MSKSNRTLWRKRVASGRLLLLVAIVGALGFRGCNLNVAVNGNVDGPVQRNDNQIDHPTLDVSSPSPAVPVRAGASSARHAG